MGGRGCSFKRVSLEPALPHPCTWWMLAAGSPDSNHVVAHGLCPFHLALRKCHPCRWTGCNFQWLSLKDALLHPCTWWMLAVGFPDSNHVVVNGFCPFHLALCSCQTMWVDKGCSFKRVSLEPPLLHQCTWWMLAAGSPDSNHVVVHGLCPFHLALCKCHPCRWTGCNFQWLSLKDALLHPCTWWMITVSVATLLLPSMHMDDRDSLL